MGSNSSESESDPLIFTSKRKNFSPSLSRILLTTASIGIFANGATVSLAADYISIDSLSPVTYENLENFAVIANDTDAISISSPAQIQLTNSGTLSTEGQQALGIDLSSGNSWIGDGDPASTGDNITLTNKVGGDISTSGKNSDAILAGSTTGDVTIFNGANLTNSGEKSSGIIGNSGSNLQSSDHAVFKGGNVVITNSGTISTTKAESSGVTGWSNGGKSSVRNSGAISTAGDSSFGMTAYSGTSHSRNNHVVQAGSDVTAHNSGSITTTGSMAGGIDLFTHGGAIHQTTAASNSIVTKGDSATGISAYSGNPFNTDENNIRDGGNITATLDGKISVQGSQSDAVTLGTYGGDIALTNRAEIAVTGNNADGFKIGSGSDGASGTVARDGGVITISNGADIVVSGANGNGFVVYSPNNGFTLNNSAKISAENGKAIVSDNAIANIINSGSLIGGVALGDGADTLANSGKLEGKFDFGDGNDALHLEAGSIFKDATFDGGDGTDTVYLGGGGTLVNTSDNPFNDFEEGTIKAGSWKISGDLQWFDTFNAASGSVLDLNGGELKSNKINLLSGSVLKGSGTLSGGVTNNGSILLASTDTLKIKGDFYSGNSSKIEFALGGGDGSTHSKLEVTGGKFTFASSAVLNIAVDANTDLAKNSRYKIATADGGVDDLSTSNDKTAVKINDSSAAFRFERTIEGNSVWITAKAAIYDVVATLAPSLAKQASAVEEFVVESGSGGVLAEQLNGLNETQLVTAVAELTTPNEAAGHNSLNSTVSTVNNIVDNRIAGRISGSSQRNFYTGNSTDDPNTQNAYRANAGQTEASEVVMAYGGEGIVGSRWLDEGGYSQAWAQAFWGNSTIEKSESNQYGTSIGLDFRPDQNTLIGGSFSYSRTNADATNSSLEADTYGGMLYGAKGFDSGLAFSGVIGYFLSQNESKRQAFGSIYSGDFDSNTFTLSGNVSQEIDLQQDWLFTPNAGVRYSHATFDDYKETGGVAPLTISRSDVDSIELSAEASFTRNFNVTEATKGLFELHFGGLYEVGDNDSTVAYRFSPTGTMLYDSSEVARLKFNVGTLVEIPFSDQISSEFAYEGTFADDYADHLLRAKFKVKF